MYVLNHVYSDTTTETCSLPIFIVITEITRLLLVLPMRGTAWKGMSKGYCFVVCGRAYADH